jgi:signal transduction histidine kinase
METPLPRTPFPPSLPPAEGGADAALLFDEERPSESGLHTVAPTVALDIADRTLRDSLSVLLQNAGRMAGDADLISVAAVVITDAVGVVKRAVAGLRARTRSDAAIVVVLAQSAYAKEADVAYEAGAMLVLRVPVDEHQLLAAVGSAIDLHTAKAQADDLLRQLDVHAHLAALGRVTAGFTHEVSNPLAVLAANFEVVHDNVARVLQARDLLAVAIDELPSSPIKTLAVECISDIRSAQELRDAAEDMKSALDRIKVVLAMARTLAQSGYNSRIEEVDLASVARDVRRWAAADLHGIDVQELIEEPITARADPRLLGQVVLNLVTNAAHAARQLPSPRIRLHVYGSADTAVLSVRDNGPGMPPEIRERIFEPFFTTRRGKGGTGLGLALCREYAAQMQAQITLWTAPGRGACFRIHMRRQVR